jgi:hypothetical protein
LRADRFEVVLSFEIPLDVFALLSFFHSQLESFNSKVGGACADEYEAFETGSSCQDVSIWLS